MLDKYFLLLVSTDIFLIVKSSVFGAQELFKFIVFIEHDLFSTGHIVATTTSCSW
jgi:hypothetical protein